MGKREEEGRYRGKRVVKGRRDGMVKGKGGGEMVWYKIEAWLGGGGGKKG